MRIDLVKPQFPLITSREITPDRLGWVDSGCGWWTHRVTGERWVFPPEGRQVFVIHSFITEDDLDALAKTGGHL